MLRGIAVYRLVATFLQLQADKQALEAKSRLAMQGYSALREQSEWTALMRHEWKNRLMALQLLCKKGDFAALGESLAALTGELEHGVAPRFTENESVDLILQDTASKAKKLGVEFHASVSLPEQLDISEQDLCALLMNLFDNALRAAGSVRPPKRREINLRMQYRQGFWAIHCDNTYDPQLEEPRGEGHGIGLKQMRMVAEKYHGMLSIDRGEMRFTVELALKV